MRFLKVRYTVFLFGGRRWVKVKIVIWGCGYLSRLSEDYIRQDVEVVAYVDNNEALWGTVSDGVEVMAPQQAVNTYPDGIYVVANVNHYEDIKEQLENLGINESNIIICNNYSITFYIS